MVNVSRYPDHKIRSLIHYVRSFFPLSNIAILVKDSNRPSTGLACAQNGQQYHKRAESLVIVRVGPPSMFPSVYSYPKRKTAPVYTMRNWKEGFVTALAHEFEHIMQFQKGGRCSEIQAELVAHCILRFFRKDRNTIPS